MTTRRLWWGMTWRGALWNAKVGILSLLTLAILNFAILALHPCLINKACNQRDYIFQFGDLGFMMALVTPFVLGILCLLFLILGAFNSNVLWFIARRYWVRQENRFHFSQFVAIIGGLLGLTEALISYSPLRDTIFVLDFHLIWIWDDLLPREASILLHTTIWVSIYTFCTLYVSRRLAHWYECQLVTRTTLDIQPESKIAKRKWLWRMTWYGLGNILFYGLLFAIGYLVIIFAIYLLSERFAFLKSLDSQIHFYSASAIASLASLISIVVNSVSGFLGGFIMGLFTDKYFHSPIPLWHHHKIARTISIFIGIACSVLGYGLVFEILLRGWKVPMDLHVAVFGIAIPSLLTVIATWFCTLQITKWYTHESTKGIAQNASSS